eukprot:TRINITY_DN2669_c0_g1_i1.p1 TRINITY_DN2669_c0_g1~~TRINITY_DN2669_c0_g1_i1.p1  ORF type:complete len:2177 (+),score=451.33 TRINITY_DN2669_c0_g1_i1:90-6620(+)
MNKGFQILTPSNLSSLKKELLAIVSSSLIRQPSVDQTHPIFEKIAKIVGILVFYDPEYILKVAVYLRQELNARSMANYFLAMASDIEECQPFVRMYFPYVIRLPSDWIDVAATYMVLPNRSKTGRCLPTCLRKGMVDKFKQFDEYQLAKYNNERSVYKKRKKRRETGIKKIGGKPELTIKQLVRQLHIAEPHYLVMCILGKKYPLNEKEFRESGIEGTFEESKAGTRMKLKIPETWETQLSKLGNTADTWISLIENKKLPFVAMMKNISNLVATGVPHKYHRWVQNRLSNASIIASSKIFPLKFLNLYDHIPTIEQHRVSFRPLRYVNTLTFSDEKKNRIKPMVGVNSKVLQNYQESVLEATKLSIASNIGPIQGNTIVLIQDSNDMYHSEYSKKAPIYNKCGNNVFLAGIFVCMLTVVCEEIISVCVSDDNLGRISSSIQDYLYDPIYHTYSKYTEFTPILSEILRNASSTYDNIILLNCKGIDIDNPQTNEENSLYKLIDHYRTIKNSDLLFFNVDLSGESESTMHKGSNNINISGYSDQILRYISERRNGDIKYKFIENINKIKKIRQKKVETWGVSPWWRWLDELNEIEEPYEYPNIVIGEKWTQARVFISSTFTDMHSERDILTRIIFPQLKELAQKLRVEIIDIDLRWGVTEEEAVNNQTLKLCLDEIDNCRPFFIGILGDRYGWVPDNYNVPRDEKYQWLDDIPTGKSITEIEITHGVLRAENLMSSFYFRDSSYLENVPYSQKDFFYEERKKNELDSLKYAIKSGGYNTKEYSCKYEGIVDNKPYVSELEDFGEMVLQDLWESIQSVFPEGKSPHSYLMKTRESQQLLAYKLINNFVGREQTIQELIDFVDDTKGNYLVVTGKNGDGKSSVLAKIACILSDRDTSVFVLPHFILPSEEPRDIVYRLCKEINHVFALGRCIPKDYKSLSSVFSEVLEEACFASRLIIIIDGLEHMDELNWLPKYAPCKFILSAGAGISLRTLIERGSKVLELPQLTVDERKVFVRNTLQKYHKKLDERPMNTQMRILVRKIDSYSPLYLSLACEELRIFGVYERVGDFIKSLGSTIPLLYNDILKRIEKDFGTDLIKDIFGLIVSARSGIKAYTIQEILQIDEALWRKIYLALSSYVKVTSDEKITILHGKFVTAIEKRYNKKLAGFHSLLVDYYFPIYKESDEALLELPYHLYNSKQWDKLKLLLTSIEFISYKIERKMINSLITDYQMLYRVPDQEELLFYKKFVMKNYHIFSEKTDLVYNIALNEPKLKDDAERLLDSRYMNYVLNDTQIGQYSLEHTISFNEYNQKLFACAHNGKNIVASASQNGNIYLYNPNSGEEIAIFEEHLAPVRCLTFSEDSRFLVSGSDDGSIRIWDVELLVCTSVLLGHSAPVSCIKYSNNGNHIISSSYDCTLKFWNPLAYKKCVSTIFTGISSINSFALHPFKNIIYIGTWNGIACAIEYHPRSLMIISRKEFVEPDFVEPFFHLSLDEKLTTTNSVTVSKDGTKLFIAGNEKKCVIWDTEHMKKISELCSLTDPITNVIISPNEKYIVASTSGGNANIYSATPGKKLNIINLGNEYMTCIKFHPLKKEIVVTGSNSGKVFFCNYKTGSIVNTIDAHDRTITGLDFSPDGKLFATSSEDFTAIIFRTHDNKKLHTLNDHTQAVTCVKFISNKVIATGSRDFTVKKWSTGGELEDTYTGHTSEVTSITNKGSTIVSASRDGTVRGGKSKFSYVSEHRDWITCLDQGTVTVTGSYDFNVIIKSNEDSTVLEGHTGAVNDCLLVESEGIIISASSDHTIMVWNLNTLKEITTLHGHSSRVSAIAYDTTSNILASVSDDGNLIIWDALNYSKKSFIDGHKSSISDLIFSDENTLISSSHDGSMKIWNITGKEKTVSIGYITFMDKELEDDSENFIETNENIAVHTKQVLEVQYNGSYLVLSYSQDECILWDRLDLSTITKICPDMKIVRAHYQGEEIYISHTDKIVVYDENGNEIFSYSVELEDDQNKKIINSSVLPNGDVALIFDNWDIAEVSRENQSISFSSEPIMNLAFIDANVRATWDGRIIHNSGTEFEITGYVSDIASTDRVVVLIEDNSNLIIWNVFSGESVTINEEHITLVDVEKYIVSVADTVVKVMNLKGEYVTEYHAVAPITSICTEGNDIYAGDSTGCLFVLHIQDNK